MCALKFQTILVKKQIQNGRHLFFKQYVMLWILHVTIIFFLTLYQNNGYQSKLELY